MDKVGGRGEGGGLLRNLATSGKGNQFSVSHASGVEAKGAGRWVHRKRGLEVASKMLTILHIVGFVLQAGGSHQRCRSKA